MRFDWKPESKERYFRKATAAVKAAGFDDILRVDKDQFSITCSGLSDGWCVIGLGEA